MRRGTTPDYLLTVHGADLSECSVFVTIQQHSVMMTLSGARLSVAAQDDTTNITFRLTQEETLRFTAGGANVQVRYIDADGTAMATDIGKIVIMPVLLEGVIEYVNDDTSESDA